MSFCCFLYPGGAQSTTQDALDYLSNHLQVRYVVETNYESTPEGYARTYGHISFTNTGTLDITDVTGLEIYLCSIRLFEPDYLADSPADSKELGASKLAVSHINGCMHKIFPVAGFMGFLSNVEVVAKFRLLTLFYCPLPHSNLASMV